MSKVNISTQGGQLSELQKLATADLPTGTPVQPAPEPSLEPGGAMDRLMAGPAQAPTGPDPVLQQSVDEGIQQGLAVQEEVERQSIPSLRERGAAESPPARWLKQPSSDTSDGGLRARASNMAAAAKTGNLFPRVSLRGTPGFPVAEAGGTGSEIAAAIAEQNEGSIAAAVQRVGAVETNSQGKLVPNSVYMQVGSAVTENSMADAAFGESAELDEISKAQGETKVAKPDPSREVAKAALNERVGQQIHQEYQRMQGVEIPDKLPKKEATAVGDAFQEMWAHQNPDLVEIFESPTTGQKVYQLTSEGQTTMKNNEAERKKLFPKQQVKPAKIPPQRGRLLGDIGTNVVRHSSGKVGTTDFSKTIESAMYNLSQVPNVVDKQRAKILLSTILPVLQSGDNSTWQAEINNVGPSKVQSYEAAEKDYYRRQAQAQQEGRQFTEEPYSARQTISDLTNKVAQEVQAIAQNRNGANYLTYYVQAFNGRIAPQQTLFDPTSSKAVRFVTRNATPSIAKPGTRVEKNLRQMYAMMLVQDADALLPDGREAALTTASPQLEAWGDRLAEVITMTDAQYEQISQAIAEGKPLDDPAYGEIPGINLDPEADADLIAKIKKKGEDGPHLIDGLIDFAKYQKAKRKGQPYASYFNAYIDGKTNGIASNGIQMGNEGVALATGVIRTGTETLLDNGDIRDTLALEAVDLIKQGWDGNVSEYEADLNTVAEELFTYRDLNKKTTMTFGYGKEVESFVSDFEEALGLLVERDKVGNYTSALSKVEKHLSRAELAQTLLNKYKPALANALSKDAMDSRSLMRSAAALHSATGSLFSIKSYTGMDLNLGRDMPGGSENAAVTRYKLQVGDDTFDRKVYHYENEPSSAAARKRTSPEGEVTETPGDYAYGGSLPGPVQSLDAATVAMSAAGRSWDRLKMNSGGNPYMHTIYDAFKLDANGYDVGLEEINNNWLEAANTWSYLEETYKATKETLNKWQQEASKNRNRELSDNEKLYMDWMLKPITSKSGNLWQGNMVNKLQKMMHVRDGEDGFAKANNAAKAITHKMKQVGYDPYDPPTKVTVAHQLAFVQALNKELNLGPRMQSMIAKTNTNKKKLMQQIKQQGYQTPSGKRIALQYYAH